MQQKKNADSGISVGSSSILVIFVVLALTAFATLSLVTARGDDRLTRRTAQAASEYYAADSLAVEAAAELSDAVAESPGQPLEAVALPLGWVSEGEAVSMRIPMGESGQELYVAAVLAGGDLRFTHWRVSDTTEWEDEESLDLWTEEPMGGLASLPET